GVWGLEKKRLYATVFETDDEARSLWQEVTDIAPGHILRFGRKDNFWEMGETGPCGPCSEIHIDLTPDGSGGNLVNAGDPRVMEIWNLVFIQNNRNETGALEPLPARHVDTGMGFERVCAVLQGKDSNYDTDVFMPIIGAVAELTGRPYTLEADRVAMRVIADHVRMLSFAIADGAIPGNEGRGYVLRRILRRAARFGRTLGMREPFIHAIAPAVAGSMGDVFPEVVAQQAHIQKVIRAEEESFSTTLDRGLEIFSSVLERLGDARTFPGDDAFKLYDTFGFPLDLTQLMASERGLAVDTGRFDTLMEEQRTRARKGGDAPRGDAGVRQGPDRFGLFSPSAFVGYETLETDAVLEHVVEGKFINLDRTPFYVRSGGQVDDTGVVEGEGFAAQVIASEKNDDRIIHEVKLLRGSIPPGGELRVKARVDAERRRSIERNHTATHLVHEALRRVLGTHVHQQGSLVAPDRLRFDFPHFAKITPEEIRRIEDIVNGKIAERVKVVTGVDMPIEEARRIPNVKMFFGDRYGDIVRVVFVDEKFSVEFCGGTHVRDTAEIGLFKIVSESGIASGVRRIEAVTGDGLRTWIDGLIGAGKATDEQIGKLVSEKQALESELGLVTGEASSSRPQITIPAGALSREAIEGIERELRERQETADRLARETSELRKEISKARVRDGASSIDELVNAGTRINGSTLVSAQVSAASMDELKSLGDALRMKLKSGVGVLGAVIDGKPALVCIVTDDLISARGVQAGRIVGQVAGALGGKGGGRPHLATAGGKDAEKLGSALRSVEGIVRTMLEA
ncbi:MAG TPA: alanine--tRNA ligase, partial [Bacteroidota bacterium]|nr:alanine--tRNA ligase [Bacteroidota bacterium]